MIDIGLSRHQHSLENRHRPSPTNIKFTNICVKKVCQGLSYAGIKMFHNKFFNENRQRTNTQIIFFMTVNKKLHIIKSDCIKIKTYAIHTQIKIQSVLSNINLTLEI